MKEENNVELQKIKDPNERVKFLLKTLDTAADPIYWMNKEGQIIYVNDIGCEVLGYDQDELIKLTIFDVDSTSSTEKWGELWESSNKSERYRLESVHKRKDGTEFPVEISSNFVKIDDSEFINGFARDITARKKAEKIIEEKIEELEKMNKIMVDREFDMIKLKEKLK